VQNTTKGRLLIAVLVITSGLLGGALGAHLGRNEFEIFLFAAGFGFLAYISLVSLVIIMMYTALKAMKRMNNE
jgi:hypothetical protein